MSDIHSNLEALKTALEYYHNFNKDKKLICLGDIVGYGPDPAECLDLILAETDFICLGNHDYAVIEPAEELFMNTFAIAGVRYSRSKLSFEQVKTIENFPYIIPDSENSDDISYSHSTPTNPERWDYIVDEQDARRYLITMKPKLCFVGHSHIPGVYSTGKIKVSGGKTLIDKNAKTIINVGSIGQPRDGDARLSFFLFDDEDWSAENIRLEYDTKKTVEKIKKAYLPDYLGKRLLKGY